jgi:hypothetical protein
MEDSAYINNLSILIVSCDRYSDIWPYFFSLFHKYWTDCPWKIFLGTNHIEYSDPRVYSLRVGDDVSWADGARKMVEHLPTDYFLLLLEDFFIQNDVATKSIVDCLRTLMNLQGGYLRLRPFPKPDANIAEYSNIGAIDIDAPYRLALQAAIWKKEVFLRLVKSGETAWEMELKGTERSRNISEGFYCTWGTTIQYRAGITLGKWSPVGIRICNAEKMQIDFLQRPKMSPREFGKLQMLGIMNELLNVFPWKLRRIMKRFFLVRE